MYNITLSKNILSQFQSGIMLNANELVKITLFNSFKYYTNSYLIQILYLINTKLFKVNKFHYDIIYKINLFIIFSYIYRLNIIVFFFNLITVFS